MTTTFHADARIADTAALAADVVYYLTQTPRQLPSRALYDPLGSALFDAICHLPWYPVTRAERRLIVAQRHAIFTAAAHPPRVIELGCGNGEKLDVLLGRDDAARGVRGVDLVDVSATALGAASALVRQGREISVVTHERRYEDGLSTATATRRAGERFLVLFLGSNIGNFDPPGADTFLRTVRRSLGAGDALLIGADLTKPERDLLLAYDDPLGVTAAFNKNLLVRLNRDLHTNFNIAQFDHRAVWNAAASRIEMHLVSRTRQHVEIPGTRAGVMLEPNETIWTESSYKYEVDRFEQTLRDAAFTPRRHWIDDEGQFLLTLASVS
jgi:dimethylhistidine N-methyltransferase